MNCLAMWQYIGWSCVKSEVLVLHRVKETRNILRKIKRRKRKWIGHILLTNFHLKHIIQVKMLGKGQWGRRRKKIFDVLEEKKKVLEFEIRSTISHFVQNSFRKRLWTCPTTDYVVIMTELFYPLQPIRKVYIFNVKEDSW